MRQDAQPQQVKVSTTKHAAFDKLESVHLSLDHAIAVLEFEGGFHRSIVTLTTASKGAQLTNGRLASALEPGVEGLDRALTQGLRKRLRFGDHVGDFRMKLGDLLGLLTLFSAQRVRSREDQPGGAPWRELVRLVSCGGWRTGRRVGGNCRRMMGASQEGGNSAQAAFEPLRLDIAPELTYGALTVHAMTEPIVVVRRQFARALAGALCAWTILSIQILTTGLAVQLHEVGNRCDSQAVLAPLPDLLQASFTSLIGGGVRYWGGRLGIGWRLGIQLVECPSMAAKQVR